MSSAAPVGDGPTPARELAGAVSAWIADDPDAATREELGALLTAAGAGDVAAAADLTDRFAGTLQFGTAGLRGELGAGPNRMNRSVVLRAAAGLVSTLVQSGAHGIVVGFDARHRSADFARDTARVASGAGLRAVLLPRPLPTPVLAFAVRHLGLDAGVMVTASHNPAPDNGYKVYLADGRQLVAPDDARIAAAIAAVGAVAGIPRDDRLVEVPDVDAGLLADYVARVAGLVGRSGPGRSAVKVVQTSVHGVGGPVFAAVTAAAGFTAPIEVAEQADPDPDFPTTPFPNPEEPGVLDLAVDLARRSGADLVIAQDPDADRCAVAVPDPGATGGWRRLTGDEVGVLLGSRLIEQVVVERAEQEWRVANDDAPGTGVEPVFARTIVSSTWLDAVAGAAGVPVVRTLTGFKWLARVPGLRYAYEEALGYCVDPAAVADKDGISAGLLVLDVAARLAATGRTLTDALDDLARAHGVFATGQLSIRVAELAERDVQLRRLADAAPRTLGGLDVTGVDDLSHPSDGLPPTTGLRLWLSAGDGTSGWVVVRPSGTERKTKCYLEVVVPVTADRPGAPVPGDRDLDTARTTAAATLTAVTADVRAVLTGAGRVDAVG